MTQPAQKPFRSKQDYATPLNFIEAVKRRLGIAAFVFDFAADASNAKAPNWCDAQEDALSWSLNMWRTAVPDDEWGWLNPPFTTIGPWANKCALTKRLGGSIAFLVPAAVGANWYRDFVHGQALVLALNGRLAFMPDQPTWLYPKDCILCLYSPSIAAGFDVWNWKADLGASPVNERAHPTEC